MFNTTFDIRTHQRLLFLELKMEWMIEKVCRMEEGKPTDMFREWVKEKYPESIRSLNFHSIEQWDMVIDF